MLSNCLKLSLKTLKRLYKSIKIYTACLNVLNIQNNSNCGAYHVKTTEWSLIMKRENNTISICVRSLSTYAEADWVTPAEALEFMDKQNKIDGSEEFIIVDYDAPFKISEYDSVSELVEKLNSLKSLQMMKLKYFQLFLTGIHPILRKL